jgi:glutathione synthase/RimK-type ligase-like ATP-grasp enzyme
MKNLPQIGTVELLSLPDDRVQNIQAKVDTGADGSSVWATDVKLKDSGKLAFTFFGPGSPHYRNQPVVTTAFRRITVKNSFGHQESRYKIRMRVKIGTKTLSCWFSLANRSHNNYPILLGKDFLKDRFVVDVSKKYLLSQKPLLYRVLVLGGGSHATRDFFKTVSGLNSLPVEYSCISYDKLLYNLDGYNTHVLNLADEGKDLASYDYIYFKTHAKHPEFSAAAAEYVQSKGRPFADKEVAQYVSASKLTAAMRLSSAGLPIPNTICALTSVLTRRLPEIVDAFGYPFVLKEIASERGKHNYLISSEKDFAGVLKSATKDQVFMAQRFVANDGFYRLNVLGKRISLSVWRSAVPHKDPLKKHLNKPSGSANARIVPLKDVPVEARNLALSAADRLNRQVAGVDILQDKTSHKWYILEVNNAPQLRSGPFLPEKAKAVAAYFDKELNR